MDMEEKGWERLELDGEFQICYCAADEWDEVRCYIIKVPDPEACPPTLYFSCPLLNLKDKKKEFSFTPKRLNPISQPKDPYPSRYFTLLGNLLYSVGGRTKDTDDTDPDSVTYFRSREVWTLDLTCPEEGWKAAPSLKYGRENPQTIVVDGKLYVFGGFGWEMEIEGSVEWMEVFDPSLGWWESLPNPPSYCEFRDDHLILYAHLEANNEIMVTKPPTKDGYEWDFVEFFSYNVRSRSWNELFQPSEERILINPHIKCGRALAIGNTLYWACISHKELSIYAFDLDKKLWASEYLYTRKIFGERERLYTTSGAGFVHLSGLKFCLMSQSVDVDKFSRYLYCFVLDLSALFHGVLNKDSNEDDEDDQHKEDDDGSVKSHLSILSIQKYLFDTDVRFLDCMIIK